MSMFCYRLTVDTHTIKDDLHYEDTLMLSYTIEYPRFRSHRRVGRLDSINRHYRRQALELARYYRDTLYPMAVEQYRQSLGEDYPFNEYSAQQKFSVTYNQNCVLSLYFDRYEYTGGAHGNTVRASDTWCVNKGRRVTLDQLFPRGFNYRAHIIQLIQGQIEAQNQSGQGMYFDNYQENVQQYFDPTHFFLTDQGVVIYFQQYEIAPYAAGIPEFLIPFSAGGPNPPSC